MAYVDNYLIGRSSVPEEDGVPITVPVEDIPKVDFPIEIQFSDGSGDNKVSPALIVPDLGSLLQGVGADGINVELSAVYEDAIEFEFKMQRLAQFPRPVKLLIDGTERAQDTTHPEKMGDATWSQKLMLVLSEPLRPDVTLELVDAATGVTLFSRVATPVSLLGTVMRGQRKLLARLDELTKEHEKLAAQTTSLSADSRERALMDRIDLFYGLIQDRLNRELRTVEPVSAFAPSEQRPQDIKFGADEIEGVGYYQLEGETGRNWRWFGPRTTLVFRDLMPNAKLLTMEFWTVPPEVRSEGIRAVVDGNVADHVFDRTGEFVRLAISLDGLEWNQYRRRSTMIVNLEFDYSFVPSSTDQRSLSASFAHGQLSY